MRAMVIGGAGFIGSHLCDSLIENRHDVICVDNFSNGREESIRHLIGRSNFVLYRTDAALQSELDEVFKKERPEIVYQMAANSDIQASANNPDVEYRNTYSTTYQTLCCMRNYGVKKLFFASTSAVYGDKRETLLTEDTPDLSPVSYYGAAKLGSEALISAFTYMNDMQSLIFRFPNVAGPRLTHGVIFDFIRKLNRDNSRLQILGDGRQTKPYIFVADLVDAIIKFSLTDKTGFRDGGPCADREADTASDSGAANKNAGVTIYNVGVEGATSVKRIADMICEEMGLSNVKYEYTGGEHGWTGDVPRFRYCLDRIHRAGWEAKLSSDEAVRRTVREVLKDDERSRT